METNDIKTLKELHKLSGRSFKTLRSNHHKKGLYSVDLVVEGYLDLLFTVANLIKVSILALDSDETCSSQVPDPPTNIKNMLEIALQLLPYEEAEFLDKSKELLLKENQDSIPEN
ncbi:hypothetical protein [Flavobacterium frigoris]|uniref:Uncharacterized protein n=1 Tax=Flavobacterium frigoris TaxID=229204 RepID=A0A1H9LH71_FLAFI|nr:hypothetical protein [Flavobacterium frigoris]SER10599.1 hypothetical protein SAMN05444355_10729 [Flavobacterium frigoris]